MLWVQVTGMDEQPEVVQRNLSEAEEIFRKQF